MVFFFYLGFLSVRFCIHRTAGKGGNSSLPLPTAPQTLTKFKMASEKSPFIGTLRISQIFPKKKITMVANTLTRYFQSRQFWFENISLGR